MTQPTLPAVLDKLISLTSERDSDALKLSLAQTLLTLADVENTTMYSAGDIIRAKHAIANNQVIHGGEVIPPAILTPLLNCLESAKVFTIPLSEDKNLTLFPFICNRKQPLAIITVEEASHTAKHALTMQILAIYHNFMALMNENERDTLTGLLNRKTFDLKINDIITDIQSYARNQDDCTPTYLAIFDIDHFKRVNDIHGHLIGDEVLLLFSQQLTKNFREKDLLFRFGGEEFVGIIQCPDEDTIAHILNRFRTTIAQFDFPQIGQVTVSCGFTKINAFDLSSKIMDRADVALYHAKHHGRNQVCQHEHLIASGALKEKDTAGGEIELF